MESIPKRKRTPRGPPINHYVAMNITMATLTLRALALATLIAMATAAATEAAKAVNSLLRFSSRDQEAMLEVLQEYFTSPDSVEDEDSEELDDLDEGLTHLEDSLTVTLEGIKSIIIIIIIVVVVIIIEHTKFNNTTSMIHTLTGMQ